MVLQHGGHSNLKDWYSYGYADSLQDCRQLILINQQGHGYSGKPHDTASYGLEQNTADILAVLDALQIRRASYFGYSMGGWIGFGVAKYALERFDSLIIGASHPYERSFKAARDLLKQGLPSFVASIEVGNAEPMNPKVKQRWLENDLQALLALTKDRPNLQELLPKINMPCLFCAGDVDPLYPHVKQAADRLPNAAFFSLPGLDHYQSFVRSDLVLPRVSGFSDSIKQVQAHTPTH